MGGESSREREEGTPADLLLGRPPFSSIYLKDAEGSGERVLLRKQVAAAATRSTLSSWGLSSKASSSIPSLRPLLSESRRGKGLPLPLLSVEPPRFILPGGERRRRRGREGGTSSARRPCVGGARGWRGRGDERRSGDLFLRLLLSSPRS